MWVRSEYAGELAVLSAWVSALLPWSVTVLRPGESGADFTLVIIRYAFFQLQFLRNLSIPGGTDLFLWVHEVPSFVTPAVEPAARAALAGAVVFALPVGLSVAYYVAEQRVEDLPVDPVRLMGGLLGAAAVAYSVAFALLWRHKAGVTVPVGLIFLWVFAVLLLRIERS